MQPMPRTQEIERSTSSGYLWIAVGLALIAVGIYLVVRPAGFIGLAIGIALLIIGAFVLAGLYMLQPNEAAILLLFGAYTGTDRTPALFSMRTSANPPAASSSMNQSRPEL